MVVLPGPLIPADLLFGIVTLLSIFPVIWGYRSERRRIISQASRVVRLSFIASLVVSLASLLLIPVTSAVTAVIAILGALVLPLLSSVGALVLLGAVARSTEAVLPTPEESRERMKLPKRVAAGAFIGAMPGVWVFTLLVLGGPFDVTVWADSPVNIVYVPLSLLVLMLLPSACAFGSLRMTAGRPVSGGLLLLGGAALLLVRLAVLLGWASDWSVSSLVQNWNSIMDLSRLPFELAFITALVGVLVVGGLCGVTLWRNVAATV